MVLIKNHRHNLFLPETMGTFLGATYEWQKMRVKFKGKWVSDQIIFLFLLLWAFVNTLCFLTC